MADLDKYLETEQKRFQDELFELLQIDSVSTDSKFAPSVKKAGKWVADQFRDLGLKTQLIETKRHPIVYAESPPVAGAPTVLVYGHYDVQPPDPLDEWISPPFEPTVRNDNVYARGATDDKGQMLTHIKSAEAWLKTKGSLPVQLKFLIEGEEECGSESLNAFLDGELDQSVDDVKKMLAADVVVISDSSQFAPGQPAITYGLKGIAYFELRLQGPKQDLHSGTFGGAVTNPANTLAKMLAKLVDADGRVAIPGFYDDVIPLSGHERDAFAALPFSDEEFEKQLGVDGVSGEKGYSTLERRWARPTCDVNGIWGGYQAEGAKTVLPAKAGAKFSFRLVPNQDPHKIRVALEDYLKSMVPPGIQMQLIDMHGAPGYVASLDSPYMQAASNAIERGFGTKPVYIREGGSIPIVLRFTQQLNADALLLGWGQNDDNTHSPNEKFHLPDFFRGIRSSAYLWEELAKIKKS